MTGDQSKTSWLKRLDGWPLVGRLWEVPAEALAEARKEVLSATLFSTLPFWFPLLSALFLTGRPAIWETLVAGGLFIYSAAIIGPLGYIVTKRHGRLRIPSELDGDNDPIELTYRFPAVQETFYIASFISLLSGVALIVQRLSTDPDKPLVNELGIVIFSVFVAVVATLLLFCVTAYRNMMEALEREHSDAISSALKDDADSEFAKWQDLKGGSNGSAS